MDEEELTPEQIENISRSADTLKTQILNRLKDQEQTWYIKDLIIRVERCYDATKLLEYANEVLIATL